MRGKTTERARPAATERRSSRPSAHTPTTSPARTPIEASVLRLQRFAGNARVSAALTVQRYEAYEHANEGDHAAGSKRVTIGGTQLPDGTRVGGVELTSGEINALADLYGSPDKLWQADPAEVARLLVLIHRQQADPGSVKESEWDDATGGRYTRLNLANAAHFGPSNPALISPPGGSASTQDNRATFLRYYSEAIVDAQTAHQHIGIPDEQRMRDWLARSAIAAGFAEHFLMDAFSAGHLFNKEDFIATLRANLDGLSPKALSGVFGTVARGVLTNQASHDLLAQYEPVEGIGYGWVQWRPNFDKDWAFKSLLEHLYEDPDGRQAVYSALVKVVHDRLSTNDAGAGQIGVPVENDFDHWVLSGDKTLATSPKTQQMIDRAIEKFRSLIEPYRLGPVEGGGYAPGSEQVLAYFPRPTADTQRLISHMVAVVTDPRQGLTDALVEVMHRELPSIIDALVQRGKIRKA